MSFVHTDPWHSGNSFGPDVISRQRCGRLPCSRSVTNPQSSDEGGGEAGNGWSFEHARLGKMGTRLDLRNSNFAGLGAGRAPVSGR